ncbi:hypothetical protein TrispH2_011530 [Trichoplax sp. H2]|uniref:Uncharacterized protein n=1 Tax=Trichoplax adhaerens TaxID=10228 RepID=B3S9C5_TRIAD|nr:predicted protein [Trichoplax adhaerens]EDV20678.1 predicted protein [Trichoplax adhaerens]RDD36443.1 hypothetical protein TrispH2_011530 [Trichoplax sp. H2]|eukprot:XP_002116878.1 predicted protein [Trichoplax adhaerens]
MASSRESDDVSFEDFLNQFLCNMKNPALRPSNNYPSSKGKHRRDRRNQQNYRNDPNQNRVYGNKTSHHRQENIESSSQEIPFLKFCLLRGSHDSNQIVEFQNHQHNSYRRDGEINNPRYVACLSESPDARNDDQDIEELAKVIQYWIDQVMVPCVDQSKFENLNATIRFGYSYITRLNPFVDQMPVTQFKDYFLSLKNPLRSRSCHVPYYLSTGFYPIFDKLCDNEDENRDDNLFILDSEDETFRVSIATAQFQDHFYVDYNRQMELVLSREEGRYCNIDIKNFPDDLDVRICLSNTITTCQNEFSSKMQQFMQGKAPVIRRNVHTGAVVVGKEYVHLVPNVRHKKSKIYKFSKNAPLLVDDFRTATVVKVVNVLEYINIDEATGEFQEIHKKNEVSITINLSQLIRETDCNLLARQLYQLGFEIIPKYFS